MAHLQEPSKTHPRPRTLGRERLKRAFGYAFAGLAQAWRSEANLRIEVWVGLVAITLAIVLDANLIAVILTTMLVLACELFNSALEAIIDMVMPTYHPLAKRAKDIAAGAVLLVSLGAIVVGLLVFVPPLWRLISN
ncbi:MAG: diacylglycerol kinase family protein [Deinococcota bacterium]